MSPLDFDPRNDGYWGDTTATLDWCEQNYEVGKWLKSNPDSWPGNNILLLIGELVHRRVLEHCDQPVHDHTSNLGHLQVPPGDLERENIFHSIQ